MRSPTATEELDLDDYARHLSEQKQQNMFVVVERIKQELQAPFRNSKELIDRQVANMDEFFY